MDYDIPKSVEQCRVKLREEFEKNRHVTDIRVIDMLVIKVCVWDVFICSVHCPIGDQILWTGSFKFWTVVAGPLDHLPLEILCHNMNSDNMKDLCFIDVCCYSDSEDCGFSCCIWSMQIVILLAFLPIRTKGGMAVKLHTFLISELDGSEWSDSCSGHF
jgi:hypothetical protein